MNHQKKIKMLSKKNNITELISNIVFLFLLSVRKKKTCIIFPYFMFFFKN